MLSKTSLVSFYVLYASLMYITWELLNSVKEYQPKWAAVYDVAIEQLDKIVAITTFTNGKGDYFPYPYYQFPEKREYYVE